MPGTRLIPRSRSTPAKRRIQVATFHPKWHDWLMLTLWQSRGTIVSGQGAFMTEIVAHCTHSITPRKPIVTRRPKRWCYETGTMLHGSLNYCLLQLPRTKKRVFISMMHPSFQLRHFCWDFSHSVCSLSKGPVSDYSIAKVPVYDECMHHGACTWYNDNH